MSSGEIVLLLWLRQKDGAKKKPHRKKRKEPIGTRFV